MYKVNSAILFQGRFSRNNVVCEYNPDSSRKIDPEIENKAKKIWLNTLEEAKNKGKKMWDQPVYRLENIDIKDDKCTLDFSTIPFSIRQSLKDFTIELLEKGPEYFPMATYSSLFIETVNGNFVFGEKSNQYMTNRKFTYIGGVFNRNEEKDEPIDLFKESLNEVEEELMINANEIEKFELLGAFSSETLNVGFIFYCKLKLTEDEVKKKFGMRNDDELKKLYFVERKNLRDFCVNKIGKESEMVDIFENNIHE